MCLVANAQNSLAPNGVGTPAILTFSLKLINTGNLSAFSKNDQFKLLVAIQYLPQKTTNKIYSDKNNQKY